MSSHPFFSCFVPVFRVTEVSSPSLFTLFLFPEWQRSAHQVWSLCSCFQCNKGQPTQFVYFVPVYRVTKVSHPVCSLCSHFHSDKGHPTQFVPLISESVWRSTQPACLSFEFRKHTKFSLLSLLICFQKAYEEKPIRFVQDLCNCLDKEDQLTSKMMSQVRWVLSLDQGGVGWRWGCCVCCWFLNHKRRNRGEWLLYWQEWLALWLAEASLHVKLCGAAEELIATGESGLAFLLRSHPVKKKSLKVCLRVLWSDSFQYCQKQNKKRRGKKRGINLVSEDKNTTKVRKEHFVLVVGQNSV